MESDDIKNLNDEQLIEHFNNECGDCDDYDIFEEVYGWVEKIAQKFRIIGKSAEYDFGECNYCLSYKFETRGGYDSYIGLNEIKSILDTINEKDVQPYLRVIY